MDAGAAAAFGVTVVDLVGRLRSTGGDKVAGQPNKHTVSSGQLCDGGGVCDGAGDKQKPTLLPKIVY